MRTLYTALKKSNASTVLKSERLAHHETFLRTCLDKKVIPQGLVLEKTINAIWGQNLEARDHFNTQVSTILKEASWKVLKVLLEHYGKVVVDEQESLRLYTEELTKLELTDEQAEDLDLFEEKLETK